MKFHDQHEKSTHKRNSSTKTRTLHRLQFARCSATQITMNTSQVPPSAKFLSSCDQHVSLVQEQRHAPSADRKFCHKLSSRTALRLESCDYARTSFLGMGSLWGFYVPVINSALIRVMLRMQSATNGGDVNMAIRALFFATTPPPSNDPPPLGKSISNFDLPLPKRNFSSKNPDFFETLEVFFGIFFRSIRSRIILLLHQKQFLPLPFRWGGVKLALIVIGS